MKQRKKNAKIKKLVRNTWSKKKRAELIEYYNRYTNLTKRRILLNQWSYNNDKLGKVFLSSFFLKSRTLSRVFGRTNSFKKKLLMWFFFRLRYQRLLFKKLNKYTFLGYLSSHFVHTCARKNLTYQNRSKFRSKVFNTNVLSAYMYTCSRLLLTYHNINQNSIYFFTSNPSKQYLWVDDEFSIQTSAWVSLKSKHPLIVDSKNMQTLTINTTYYSLDSINSIISNKELLQQFFDESDKSKKEALWNDVCSKLDSETLEIIPFVYKIMSPVPRNCGLLYNHYILRYIEHYKKLLKY